MNEEFPARSRKSRDCAEAYFTYGAQEIPKIDVEIVAKGHLWMETNQIPSQLQAHNGIELARIFHESLAATTDVAVLPGVLGCWPLRRTVQVRLGPIPRYGCQVARPSSSRSLRSAQSRKRVPSFVVSRHQFMKYPG